ncbi:hypothetical protein [Pseudomonas aeruginosa]|uniref:hypothetical protein n=1 Tax=Pseudomonas aeruginosa TaxID=287 RepID=UPI00141A3E2B|nr:hypothetical protein [Pseudomonas aeruginosa]
MKVREMPQVAFRLKPHQKDWLERKAEQEERSQALVMMRIVEEAMQRDQQQA